MKFAKETDLCAAFIKALPKGWTAYPETGGFDILISRDADGFQIGIEAKLKLNAKVICQAAESVGVWAVDMQGPDCRAVLIPDGVSMDMAKICELIGITCIKMRVDPDQYQKFRPNLPSKNDFDNRHWFDRCPSERVRLPDYIPDVLSGDSAPVKLTEWKIKAIKISITLERRGFIVRGDFKHHKISMSMWSQNGWIVLDRERRIWVSNKLPDFKGQHPVNYSQIEADFDKWKSPEPKIQGKLL